MNIADALDRGGADFDRCAELRGDADALARMQADPAARAILFWRGRVLVEGDLVMRVPLDHPGVSGGERVFLGVKDGPVFACHARETDGFEGGQPDHPGGWRDRAPLAGPRDFDKPGQDFVEMRQALGRFETLDLNLASAGRALLGWHRMHRFCAACGGATEIDQGGWRRVCRQCGRAHFPRTDPVVIMLATHEDKVLVGRGHGWPEGMYSLLAGFVEPGETIEAAARRELVEEASIRGGAVRYLASQPWPFPSSLMIGCAVEALSGDIDIDPIELTDARWLSRKQVADALEGLTPGMWLARKGTIARALLESWVADRSG